MSTEAERLEQLWAGDFGTAYTHRNSGGFTRRKDFWLQMCTELKPKTVLEVGCNACGNLKWIEPMAEAYGIDVNKKALEAAKMAWPALNLIHGKGRDIPFKDDFFDLTFTSGVLIHQPEESLRQVMGELVRCSKRYVLAIEYFGSSREEVPYRKQEGALFRDNYGLIYQNEFKLKVVTTGGLGIADGFDDCTYWLMEK